MTIAGKTFNYNCKEKNNTQISCSLFLLPCVQQGYAFGRIGLCIICMYVYYVAKKAGSLRSYCLKSLISAIYCSLISLTTEKGAYYARQYVQGKKFGGILLMGRGKGFFRNCITVSHALSTCNAAGYAMLLQLQCRPIQYRYIVCTDND